MNPQPKAAGHEIRLEASVQATDWPEISYFEDGTDDAQAVLSQLEFVEQGEWVKLYRSADGIYWRIDEWGKYQTQFLVRLSGREGWRDYDATGLQKELLRTTRGESPDQECRWAACSNPALTEMEFCIDHLWSTGHRR